MENRQLLGKIKAIKVTNKKRFKRLNILLFALAFSLSGCSKNLEPQQEESQEVINIETLNNIFTIESDNVIVLTDYEEYKDFLINPSPSYDELYTAVKNNKSIPKKYKEVYNKIISLFQRKKISPENLAIFYHNLNILLFKTNYQVDSSSEEFVAAFFTADPDNPSITVDPNNIDFYAILHEIIHSAKIAQIRVGDKIVYVTCEGIEKLIIDTINKITLIENYGISFVEGQAEYISKSLYNNKQELTKSAYSYTINNSILEFWLASLKIDLDDFFSYSIKDFEESLINLGIPKETVKNIINQMDSLIFNGPSSIQNDNARQLFYENYIPNLVEYYLKEGYNSKEIYKIIGKSLKSSVIEAIHDENDREYRRMYLNKQKALFDMIDNLINEILIKHNKETSSIYYYIGHEFQIYYELYGEDSHLDSGSYYLAHNWDQEAAKNSNIFLYVEDNKIKIGTFANNPDGTVSCYDYYGELKDVKKGIKLWDLFLLGGINIVDGCIELHYTYEDNIILINTHGEECVYNKASVSLSEDRYFYRSEGKLEICNLTTNSYGEEIPYYIFAGQIYILPESSQKIGSLKELDDKGIITLDKNNIIKYRLDALEEFINNKASEKPKSYKNIP